MFLVIGYVIVIGSVLGGFMMESGNPALIWQPAEFVIIVGAGRQTCRKGSWRAPPASRKVT